VNTSGAPTGFIYATGNITGYFSDKRLKDRIEIIQNCIEKLQSINGLYYTQNEFAEQFGYKDYSKQIGVIAQEIEKVLPELTTIAPFDLDENGNSKTGENYLTVRYKLLVPIIVQAIKKQQEELGLLIQKIEGN